jgi:DsbC/DsbD-like thiol-disulfide interchange protein
MMISRRAALHLPLLAAPILLVEARARAEETTGWVSGLHSRVRLVAGGLQEGGPKRLAGIAFELDAGFKTYWRSPGESGLPSAFDWAGSENLAAAEVLWPAPSRFEDQGGVAYGYKDRVLLPVRIAPNDAAQPVRVRLKLDYGICREICIPASASLALKLGREASAVHRAAIEKALAKVPKAQPLGAASDLAILGLEPKAAAGKPSIEVLVRAPQDATLFVEAPESWYLAAGQMEHAPADKAAGQGRFAVEILERPRDPAGVLDLRLTLVAGERAVETSASLDTARLPR